ncbi:Uroporphyrin-III C/tetrapyrrole (Corrin/Porphyrin) methyltransferase [Methylocella silvestris BL2]|uniref:Ribosomal RNA small subunit methyltransferase I n=1 Tax=Methylocella silvestris (strain DSM 15510 / CIP 108128 / LMG 27833 / NCIMB 13906 / BL2) TaxID=395965 RepID=B8EP33_METSB|nr:16S rRNA (cytidine(1402)-2'-O)-methyltransferase [Methylocella silvestris]ACK49271.1 Uroporphyrin-III C/tetrapyrrole (Corrin/Porphyrin) methyltransferase [Methylocella silvestris BL2]
MSISDRERKSADFRADAAGKAEGGASSAFTAFGLRAEAEPIRKGLHVVATPIGNLGDISFRALATLAAADAVVAEDTRVTKTLLAHYGIATPLVAYHEHNAAVMRPHLLARLAGGAALALVSDAGTPLVSDPGYRLVADALAQNIEVISVPGASAVLAALVVAGLPTDRFFFEGFLPPKSAARRQRIAELAPIPGTLVFFESPRRIVETVADLAAVLGPRDAALARELTKYYETVRRAPLPELAAALEAEGPPKGEIVLLVGPPDARALIDNQDDIDARLTDALETLSVKDAAAIVSAATGQPRRKVYARAIELTGSSESRNKSDEKTD